MQPVKFHDLLNQMQRRLPSWYGKLNQAWQTGNRAGYGFAIGDEYDTLASALAKSGYELIGEMDGLAVGTNGINSVIVVVNVYGPWAVDITDTLLTSKEIYQSSRSYNARA
ncbi:MAG: hypothetical protein AB1489_30610 [Acidobacteriota bacterium]